MIRFLVDDYMNKKFNVAEILLSVDEINSDKKYSAYVKLKSKSNNNRIVKKDIKMEDDKFGSND